MVSAVTSQIKIDNSGLKDLKQFLSYVGSHIVKSGVINEDADTTEIAAINEFGLLTEYSYGPFKGEAVLAPRRSFIQAPVEKKNKKAEIKGAIEKAVLNNPSKATAEELLQEIGSIAKSAQEHALDTNGEGIAGWQKWQDIRTVLTKGHGFPLHTRYGETFPIDYDVVKRG